MLANPAKEPKILRIHFQSSCLSFALDVSSSRSRKEHEFLKKSPVWTQHHPFPFFILASCISECSPFETLEILKQVSLKWKARSVGLSGSPDWGKEEQRLRKDYTYQSSFFFLFFNRSMITCSNFSQLFFAYTSSFFNFPHLLRLQTFLLLLALKFFWWYSQPLSFPGLLPNPVYHGMVVAAVSKGPWPWDFSQGPSNGVKQTTFFIYPVPWAAAA